MKTVIYLALVLLSINNGANSEPPRLSQSDEVTLEVNQTFRIRCDCDQPIRWMNSIESQDLDENERHHFPDPTYYTLPDGRYGSEMVLERVKFGSVGYYYCIKNITYDEELMISPKLLDKIVDDEEASRIYVFVRDFDHLIAPVNILQFVIANKNEDTVVPCKPTSKETTVELVSSQNFMSSDTSSTYDPKIGFIINIDRVEESGDYKCRPKYPSVTNEDECVDFMVEFVDKNPAIEHFERPNITSLTEGHAIVGSSFTFECTLEYDHNIYLKMQWEFPSHVNVNDNRFYISPATYVTPETKEKKKIKSELTINNVHKDDEGIYKCKVLGNNNETHQSQILTVMEEGENYLEMKTLDGYEKKNYDISIDNFFQLAVEWKSFPHVPHNHIIWFKDGVEIQNDSNYEISIKNKIIIFRINKVSYNDRGTYTLQLNNTLQRKSRNFTFTVIGKPEVLLSDQYVIEGQQAVMDCTVLSTSEPYIVWEYKKCSLTPEWPTCSKYLKNFNITTERIPTNDPVVRTVRMTFTPDEPGFIRCSAKNNVGESAAKASLLIGDIPESFYLEGHNPEDRIAIGDEVILKCSTLLYNKTSNISWLRNDFSIEARDDIIIENFDTKYSHQSTLRIPRIESRHNGIYKCYAGENVDSRLMEITAYSTEALVFNPKGTPDNQNIEKKLADSLEISCKASGLPVPKVQWFKDGKLIFDDEIYSFEDPQILTLKKFVRPEDEGEYKCVLANRLEEIQKTFRLNVNGGKMKPGVIFFIVAFILGLIVAIIYLIWQIKRKNRELKKAGLYRFAEGNIEHYNPALDLDEQAELLPYDNNFEFPRESLKFGKQLGAGAFGIVVEAMAKRIKPTEEETKVAVKMVKKTADSEVIMALVSELKIMIHMGQHLNVVNLLGAVTKKIAKREIMIIVEYCEYGNVQNLLMKNRKYFINQINPETDKIDKSIQEKRSSACEYESNINGLRYIRPVFTKHYSNDISASRSDNDPRSGTRAGRPNSRGYLRHSDLYDSNIDSCNTEQTIMTTIPEGDGSAIMSNNSVQPAWRSNYKPQNTDPIALTTSDLVSWAYQVAKGMEYLSSKKVLHGDLAARNILLSENNVVKICDFGLARSMYKGDNYKKQGEARLPIKWLALESLESQVFSTYTDVWSYGIVLWEFFSLAKVPYPGMDVHPNFLNKLKDGYRMEKPTYANQELYDIMLACWNVRPESRPLFNELANRFGEFLEEDVTNHYMQLNEPYMTFNDEYLSKKELDLNILRPPEKMAPKAPIYVNGNVNRFDIPQIRIDKGNNDNYLQMNANVPEDEGIFSPTRNSDEVFNYPSLKKPEEIPMLSMRTQRFSDSEGEHSPDADSRSRGFHELNHSISSTDDNQDNEYLDTKSYLGMNGGTRDAFSNPSYQMLKTVNEK